MKTRLPWGETELELDLPADWRVIVEAQPKSLAPCASAEKEFHRAIAEPIGAAPLSARDLRGKKIVLVVDDLTRPTPAHLVFPSLLGELERAGADRRGLLMISALGVHRPMSEAEMEKKVGGESMRGLRWENHDARDAQRLAFLGTTRAGTPVHLNRHLVEADLIVSVGTIEPHVLAGFGGGLKNLVPGCAGALTIGRNHLCGISEGPLAQIGTEPEANPLRRDLEEAAALLGKEVFLINTVLNPQQEIVRIFAGHPLAAHREGIKLTRAIYGVPVPEPADVLITDSSPMDTDLRQGGKCIGNLLAAVKEGGTILAFLRCREGVGDFKIPPRSLPRPLMKTLVRGMSRARMLSFLERFRRDLDVEEKFLAFYSLQILRRNQLMAYAPSLGAEQARRLALFKLIADPQEMVRQARRRVPRRATVAIFPRGGVTFPILSGAPGEQGAV
jgi:nickel-dependent lactate racemase